MVSLEDVVMIDNDDVDFGDCFCISYWRLAIASTWRANYSLLVRGVGYFGGGIVPFVRMILLLLRCCLSRLFRGRCHPAHFNTAGS